MADQWRAVRGFVDWDGVVVPGGTVIGEVVRRGYSEHARAWFWNGVRDGRVTCVTLGFPPQCEKVA